LVSQEGRSNRILHFAGLTPRHALGATAGSWVGLVPLGARFYAFLFAVTAAYLAIVEVVKRRVMTAL